MELLWLIFVTFVAVGFAYFCGGIIDRRSLQREAERAAERRAREIDRAAALCRTLAGSLVTAGLVNKEHLLLAAQTLCGGLFDDELSAQEQELVLARITQK